MIVEQLYTGCLAEAAYYIESDGEAVVIDPLRESQPYLNLAARSGARIKYILETHFHADFVSGHLELSRKTGATIVFGPTAEPHFIAHIAKDREVLKVGKVSIEVLHTPGHTMESSSFLLKDENGKDYAVFTGDTLFLGDVGRPDLAIKQGELTREDLAGYLYDSLQEKIMPLADDVIVYPGHGAGSACGKKMSCDTWGYLGDQKLSNYALEPSMTKEEFIAAVTDGLVAPPQYFPKNAQLNKKGYGALEDIIDRLAPLSLTQFANLRMEPKTLVLDTRSTDDFVRGHIPDSLFVGIDDNFAVWVGALVDDLKTPIILITDPGREEEVVTRLARVGYDNPIGYLAGSYQTWAKANYPTAQIAEMNAENFADSYEYGAIQLLDVRKISEYATQHVAGSENLPLDFIYEAIKHLRTEDSYYLYCVGGYRSVIASSILLRHGFRNLVNIRGGFRALSRTKLPKTEFAEQATAL
ncbi:MAG: rhodanese-like domain-containing protein [Bacteroidota bacterium]